MEKICNTCKVLKSFSEYGKNSSVKSGLMGRCKQCINIVSNKRYADNPEWFKEYRKTNAEKIINRVKIWKKENPLSVKTNAKRFREKDKEKQSIRVKKWAKNNTHKRSFTSAKYRAAKIKAIPKWANLSEISYWYETARAISLATGIIWHVDHIVPLQSDLVCGLHWEGNFQILPGSENQSKSNLWWPDMPEVVDDSVKIDYDANIQSFVGETSWSS